VEIGATLWALRLGRTSRLRLQIFWCRFYIKEYQQRRSPESSENVGFKFSKKWSELASYFENQKLVFRNSFMSVFGCIVGGHLHRVPKLAIPFASNIPNPVCSSWISMTFQCGRTAVIARHMSFAQITCLSGVCAFPPFFSIPFFFFKKNSIIFCVLLFVYFRLFLYVYCMTIS